MSTVHKDVRLAKARVSAFARTSQDRVEVAKSVGNPETKSRTEDGRRSTEHVEDAEKRWRSSPGHTRPVLRNPWGRAARSASYAVKGREAANLESLASETARAARHDPRPSIAALTCELFLSTLKLIVGQSPMDVKPSKGLKVKVKCSQGGGLRGGRRRGEERRVSRPGRTLQGR